MKTNFVFTRHAFMRYVQRVAPELDMDGARAVLEASSPVKLQQRGRAGTTLWLIEPPRAFLVTKTEEGREVVVTVLGPTDLGIDERGPKT